MNWAAVLAASLLSSPTLTLEEARQLAGARSPELNAAKARVEAVEAELALASAARRPVLGFTLEAGVRPGAQLVEIPGTTLLVSAAPSLEQGGEAFQPVPIYRATLDGAWTLTNFGRTDAAEGAAKARRQLARARASAVETAVEQEVDRAYVGWLAAVRLELVAAAAAAHARGRGRQIAADIRDGAAPPGASLPIELASLRAELQRVEAENAADEARARLSLLIGRPVGDRRPEFALLDGRVQARRSSPDGVDVAELALAEAQVEQAERARRPDLVLTAQLGLRGQELSFFPVYAAGLRLSVPLLDGGRSAAQRRAMTAEVSARASERAQARALWTADEGRRARTRASVAAQLALTNEMVEVARRWQSDAEARRAAERGQSGELERADAAVREAERRRVEVQVRALKAQLDLM